MVTVYFKATLWWLKYGKKSRTANNQAKNAISTGPTNLFFIYQRFLNCQLLQHCMVTLKMNDDLGHVEEVTHLFWTNMGT